MAEVVKERTAIVPDRGSYHDAFPPAASARAMFSPRTEYANRSRCDAPDVAGIGRRLAFRFRYFPDGAGKIPGAVFFLTKKPASENNSANRLAFRPKSPI
jgi:hypothetical protein